VIKNIYPFPAFLYVMWRNNSEEEITNFNIAGNTFRLSKSTFPATLVPCVAALGLA